MEDKTLWDYFNLAEQNPDQGGGILYCLRYDQPRIKAHQVCVVNALKSLGLDLVEIGIDILNPVQPECMNQVDIKKKYGDKITIDTGISVQKTLPFGTVDDVKKEVKYALKHLAPGGGFVYGTSHYAMYDVPIENIVALYDTCKKHGKYPIIIK